MPLAAGETITWTLPGFSGPREPFTVSVALEEAYTAERFSWDASWSQAAHQLVVTAPGNVVPIASINIIVPPAAGLRVPPSGVRVDSGVVVKCDAALGPVAATPPTDVSLVQPVNPTHQNPHSETRN